MLYGQDENYQDLLIQSGILRIIMLCSKFSFIFEWSYKEIHREDKKDSSVVLNAFEVATLAL